MRKKLTIILCLLLTGCNQKELRPVVQSMPIEEKRALFLPGLELANVPVVEELDSIEITPIKPIKNVRNSCDITCNGPSRQLNAAEKALFKQIFCTQENFNFKIKKKCIFVAEFMISFEQAKDFLLFVSLSTNQIQILNKNAYQIIDFSTYFESSEGIAHLRSLLTL